MEMSKEQATGKGYERKFMIGSDPETNKGSENEAGQENA